MGTHLRFTPVLALVGALALGTAPAARAQDTSSIRAQDTSSARADTSGVQGYGADSSSADTGRMAPSGQAGDSGSSGYNGAPSDTALRAKPGVQTGPSAKDSSKTGQSSSSAADTVVCKDGSNSQRTGEVCLKHGGIDWAATEAALKARGQSTSGMSGDSASADTALRAKPGVQTGPTDSSAAAHSDSASSH
jgi:hypothetical protein